MKQKLFTLLTLLCFAVSGAWAQTTLFEMTVKASGSDYKVSTSSELDVTTSNYLTSLTGSMKVGLLSGSDQKVFGSDNSEYHFRLASNNAYAYITLTGSYVLAEGDVISFSESSTGTTGQPGITKTKERSTTISTSADEGNKSGSYTIPAESPLIGESSLYLWKGGSNTYIKTLTITRPAPPTPTLTGAWKISSTDVTGETANVVQGSASPTVPTFSVGATSGTPTTENYTVAYSLKDGSTEGIFTYTSADGPTAISTSTAGSATIVATLTTKDASAYLTPATNTFEYTVTVSAASAPTISVLGESSAVRGADAITLTADVTGVPTPTIEWFQCEDALKTNPVSQGAASTANTSFDVATTTVGTYYYYAVANNGVGGDVESSVKTITIVPKAPSITAGGKFVTSKTVTITKADGEAGAATIKYSTNGGSTWNDYSEPFSVNATTTVDAKVVQSGLESAEVSATYTLFVPSELTSISTATTWDFNNISANSSHAYYANSGIQLTSTTFPTKTSTDFYVYGDFVDDFYTVKAGKTFNGAALAFSATEYPIRNTYAMGTSLKFKTTVPGVIKVKFNNTGTSARPYRYLKVNDDVTEYKSANATAVTTNGIYVPAGEVVVSGYIVNASDPSSKDGDVVGPAMLQISQLFFEPLDDADAVSVTSAGYATFVLTKDAYFDATPEVTAYAAKAADTKITLTEVKAAPAGTPILLKADEGNYTLKKASSIAPAAVSANDLEAGPVTDSDGTNYYVLGKEGSKVGFGLLADGVNLPATKAYIAASKFAEARSFFAFDEDGETTGITNINSKREFNGEFYNLAGQKVQNPTKGLYIMNGKKVIVK